MTDEKAGPTQGVPAVPTWEELPGSARQAAVALAAAVLSRVPDRELPAVVAPVARFAPKKRATAGAQPLRLALKSDQSFRALVAQYLPRQARGSDIAENLARAFLMQMPVEPTLAGQASKAEDVAAMEARISQLTATVESLTARLTATSSRRPDQTGERREDTTGRAEIEKLRKRLRDQGSKHHQQRDALRAELSQMTAERDAANAELAHRTTEVDRWRNQAHHDAARATAALNAVARVRAETGRERSDADRRIDLLLHTLTQAAAGLRREWQISSRGDDPADVAIRDLPAAVPERMPGGDSAMLGRWIALPQAHLIIDGYNVTKTGYPELSLADQRRRIIGELAALHARTGVEVTVVFDGADVIAPTSPGRAVRVVFSPAGVIADDIVRDLAAAEPAGRVVIVVSSDHEVVDGTRRSGARTAPSSALLEVLSRR